MITAVTGLCYFPENCLEMQYNFDNFGYWNFHCSWRLNLLASSERGTKYFMKKVVAIWMIVLLLTGQTGLTIGIHFCQGSPVRSKILVDQNHLGCGEGGNLSACDTAGTNAKSDAGIQSIPCCKDEIQLSQISTDSIKESLQNVSSLLIVPTVITTLSVVFFHEMPPVFSLVFSSPDAPGATIRLLIQSFLK